MADTEPGPAAAFGVAEAGRPRARVDPGYNNRTINEGGADQVAVNRRDWFPKAGSACLMDTSA